MLCLLASIQSLLKHLGAAIIFVPLEAHFILPSELLVLLIAHSEIVEIRRHDKAKLIELSSHLTGKFGLAFKYQCNRHSVFIPRSSSSAYSMNIGLPILRIFVIDHEADFRDIKAPAGHVGCDHQRHVFLKLFDDRGPLLLNFVPVDDHLFHVWRKLVHDIFQVVAGFDMVAENDDLALADHPVNAVEQPLHFGLRFLKDDHFLLDVLVCGVFVSDCNLNRVPQVVETEMFDVIVVGGRKKQGLSLWSNLAENRTNLGLKSKPEHFVGLINHNKSRPQKVKGFLFV